jgi:hypothetical protein
MRRPGSVIVLLKGGLGNQLFQVAAGLVAASARGQTLQLACPAFALDRKRSPDVLQVIGSDRRVAPWKEALLAPLVMQRIARFSALRGMVLTDRDESLLASPQLRQRLLSGYFQHHRFSAAVAPALSERLARESTVVQADVAVHVRRADFLSIPTLKDEYERLLRSYYGPAIEQALQRAGNGARLCVVSDDPEGAIADFGSICRITTPMQGVRQSLWSDLATLSRARQLVCSNSTFCWWAARVSSGQVFMPRMWLERERARSGCNFEFMLPSASLV